ATELQLHVLDATKPGLPGIQAASLTIPNSAASGVAVSVAPNGQLLALITQNGDVLRWDTDINTKPAPNGATKVENLGANLTSFALSSDGAVAYASGGSNIIQVLTIATKTKSTINVLPAGAQISSLLTVKSTGSDVLAAADTNGNKLHVVKLNPAALAGTTQ